MTDQECEVWAETPWGRAMLPNLYVQLFVEVFRDASILGSLIRPEKMAREYVAKTYPNDPPEFHAWAAKRWMTWLTGFRQRHEAGAYTDEDRLTLALAEHRGLKLAEG